jgi:hypothetical protein
VLNVVVIGTDRGIIGVVGTAVDNGVDMTGFGLFRDK